MLFYLDKSLYCLFFECCLINFVVATFSLDNGDDYLPMLPFELANDRLNVSSVFITTPWTAIRNESRKRNGRSFCRAEFKADIDLCNKSAKLSVYDDTFNPPNCYCDERCHLFGDCCIDKAAEKAKQDRETSTSTYPGLYSPWSCVHVPINGPRVYAYHKCDPAWLESEGQSSHGEHISHLCEHEDNLFLARLPAFSVNSGIFYRNFFCAVCNNDDDNLDVMNVTIFCDRQIGEKSLKHYLIQPNFNPTDGTWTFRHNSSEIWCKPRILELEREDFRDQFNTRYCMDMINSCPSNWTDNHGNDDNQLAQKCSSYMFMVKSGDKIFKNLYCAQCNGLRPDETSRLNCKLDSTRPSTPSTQIDAMASMRALFELSPLCNLRDGYAYDSPAEKCVPLKCLPSYHLNRELLRCDSLQFTWNGTILKSDCMRIFINESDYTTTESNQVHLRDTGQLLDSDSYQPYSYLDKRRGAYLKGILICYDQNHRYVVPFLYNQIQGFLSFVTLTISIVGLTAYLLIYLIVPRLRNLRAMMVMSLSAALLVASIAFVGGVLSRPYVSANIIRNERGSLLCVITAVSIHYFYLASFAWMNVMAYDAWKSFKRNHERLSNSLSDFLKYSLYSWLLPAIIVLISCSLDLSNVNDEYQPLYGHRVCWISQKKALLAFFVLPVSIIILINIAFFSFTAYALVRTNRETRFVLRSKHVKESSQHFILYVRLATIMGLTWIFGILAALTSFSILWYPFIILNGLQGAFIFFYFACKENVFRHLKAQISQLLGVQPTISTSKLRTCSSSLMPTISSSIANSNSQ
ncbi:uncharacterized protein LOC141855292 [Brevipalpus obovatus]|uniref:uncharacterized protein LOC141855292 n=1 Tax=Brevipalpus obovatus TaxID=246614 RepID=UPI003D9DDB19